MTESEDESLTIAKPKKERSEKQKEHLAKLHLANVSATSKKAVKAGIIEHLNSGVKNNTIIESSDEEEEEKPKPEPKAKAKAEPKTKKEPEPKPKKEPTIIYQDASSSDEEEVIIVKKKRRRPRRPSFTNPKANQRKRSQNPKPEKRKLNKIQNLVLPSTLKNQKQIPIILQNKIFSHYIMNPWIEHVKAFAKKHNLTYGAALSHPDIKKGYVKKA